MFRSDKIMFVRKYLVQKVKKKSINFVMKATISKRESVMLFRYQN